MLVRKFDNNKVVKLELGYNQAQEQQFVTANPNMGYMYVTCLLYTSPSPRDRQKSRMPSSA